MYTILHGIEFDIIPQNQGYEEGPANRHADVARLHY